MPYVINQHVYVYQKLDDPIIINLVRLFISDFTFRFGISDKALSLHEFPAVVEALDHHVQLLAQHLPDPIVRHLPRDSADHPVGDYPWEQAEMLGHVLCCLAG